MILSPVPVAGVRDVWPTVKVGLDYMLEKYQDRWLPEDVYMELRSGTAFLYMIDGDEGNVGFTVVKNKTDFDGNNLFVWILYAEPHALKHYRDAILGEFDKLAKSIKAKRIQHHSPRSGWEEDGAFKLKMHVYEREV